MTAEQVGPGGSDGVYFPNTKIGFYGLTTTVAQQSVAQQTTKTTTQLRVELTALQDALAAYNFISVT